MLVRGADIEGVVAPGPLKARIDVGRQHRSRQIAQVLAALARGPTTIKAMVPTLYAAVDPRLHPAAAMSVLAHMLLLVREGRVTCEGVAGLDSVYRLS